VVLVTWAEADRYCAWRGAQVGAVRRLPTADEFEKAARGEHGAIYPWGDAFDASKLSSAVAGPRDVVDAGSVPAGASPYGVLDAAGNVFQWTSTPFGDPADRKMTVKGSAWDDYAGVGRGASAHGRPRSARHVIVGFRCAGPS
jgi:formylglycine-generating enzyme required for sulfatase activity